MSCRCPSCGYIHDEIDAQRPVLDAEPVVLPVEIIPAVVQQARCPLCGDLFDEPALYDEHRTRECAPPPPEVVGAAAGDPPAAPAAAGDPATTDQDTINRGMAKTASRKARRSTARKTRRGSK